MSDALTDAGLSFRHILSAAEASLRRLNTDYIDLYQVHFNDRITPIDETVRALDNLVRRGPLAGGFLSGKYTREDPKGGGGRLAAFDFPTVDKDLGYAVVDTLKGMAYAHGTTAAAVALA